MKKAIVITGASGSGKSIRLRKILSNYKKEEVILIRWNKYIFEDPFLFRDADERTKVIAFEDVGVINYDNVISLISSDRLQVDCPGKPRKDINAPQFIFVSAGKNIPFSEVNSSLTRRIENIKL